MNYFIKTKESVEILIPVCNEADTIGVLLEEWLEVLKELPSGSRITLEDGNSSDGTIEILRRFSNQNTNINAIFMDKRDGFSKAVGRLLAQSNSDWLFVADSDGQYFTEDFWTVASKVNENVDFVKGVKVNRQDNIFRRFFSFLMNRFIVVLLGFPLIDYNSSHYLVKRSKVTQIVESFGGWKFKYSINVELAMKLILSNTNFQIAYIRHSVRANGVSRGNAPLKFLGFGIRTLRDIWNLKKKF
jgi:glycosyltransferase involved in cell wall biosynthesis